MGTRGKARQAFVAAMATLGIQQISVAVVIRLAIYVAVLTFIWITGHKDDALADIWAKIALTVVLASLFPVVFCWHYFQWARKLQSRLPNMSGLLLAAIAMTTLAVGAWGWFLYDWSKGPITWTYGDGPHPIYGMRGNYPMRPIIQRLQMTGTNRSDETITDIDAVLHSNANGRDYPAYFQIQGKYIRTNATTGIPPHTDFMLIFPLTNDTAKFDEYQFDADTFLAQFAPITVKVTYSGRGSPYAKRFSKEDLAKPLDEFDAFIRDSVQREKTPGIIPK